jgi:hypothetical protein
MSGIAVDAVRILRCEHDVTPDIQSDRQPNAGKRLACQTGVVEKQTVYVEDA